MKYVRLYRESRIIVTSTREEVDQFAENSEVNILDTHEMETEDEYLITVEECDENALLEEIKNFKWQKNEKEPEV